MIEEGVMLWLALVLELVVDAVVTGTIELDELVITVVLPMEFVEVETTTIVVIVELTVVDDPLGDVLLVAKAVEDDEVAVLLLMSIVEVPVEAEEEPPLKVVVDV